MSGHTYKTKHTICYPDPPLAFRSVLYGGPKRPGLRNLKCDEVMDWNEKNSHEDKEYVPPGVYHHLTTQPKLNNLTCALNL